MAPMGVLLALTLFHLLGSGAGAESPANRVSSAGSIEEDRTHLRLAPRVPAREQAIRGRQHFPGFSIELPRGWRKVMLEAAAAPGAPMLVRFEGPSGLYFHVEWAPQGHGVSADAMWRCGVADDGRLTIQEAPRCTIPAGVEPEEEGCSEGDGRLDIFTLCAWSSRDTGDEVASGSAVFMFGNTLSEAAADDDLFRRILRTVRVRR